MQSDQPTSEQCLQRLLQGNRRFFSSQQQHPRQENTRRLEIKEGQQPFASILTCADSRITPEIIFDQGLGDLFVVRIAGNIQNDHVLGSLEYSVLHLNTPLIVVMGHTNCGMITGVVENTELAGSIASLAPSIQPHVENVRHKDGDLIYNATIEVTRQTARQLRQSEPILADRVRSGNLQVQPAMYELSTGKVSLL